MFPITFNAIGDILALAQLIRDIVWAVNDACGAAVEYRRFTHELKILGAIMVNAHLIADGSREDTLKEAVLEEVRFCYTEIVDAGKLLPGFDVLMRSTDGSGFSRVGVTMRKLQWHFLKASDAAIFAARFQAIHTRLGTLITTFTQ